jgi:homoserine dehydrogenase
LKTLKLGICGLGTVGSGTFNVLKRNANEINARAGMEIEVAQVGARRDNPACDLSGVDVTRDIFDVVKNPDIDIVAELIGGTTVAKELVMLAIENGKHVVTANKALIAECGNEIFAAAEKQGVTVAFEAGVAGGIPIIKAIREGLSANKIESLAGIINGTGNFILTEMTDKGRDFADVLKEAQELGYAEADPTFDVEGIDAAHKLAILASIAFGVPLNFDKVYTEGISQISTQDIEYAQELNYKIKHLGIAAKTDQGIEMRVHPALISTKQLLASVDGVMNAVSVKGDAVGQTLYYGAGAGAEPTASAVIADIVDLARVLSADPEHRVPHLGFVPSKVSDVEILSIDDVHSAYYLRFMASDHAGVLANFTGILSDLSISISALVQKEYPGEWEPVVIITNQVSETTINEAIRRLEALDDIQGQVIRIRVATLD